MGREIRRVPSDWEHPRNEKGEYRSLYDQSHRVACEEYFAHYLTWKDNTEKHEFCKWPWDYYGDPPSEDHYRKREWTAEEATHYQMYQTVSEGTPVSPVFATKDDLAEWLVSEKGHSRAAAEAFCKSEWAPSMMMDTRLAPRQLHCGVDAMDMASSPGDGQIRS